MMAERIRSYKKLLFLLIIILSVQPVFAKERIVILPFVDKSSEKDSFYSEKITSLVEDAVTKSKVFDVLAKNELERIAGEKNINLNRIMNENDAAELGRRIDVQRAVRGVITEIENSKSGGRYIAEVAIDVDILNMETGGIHNSVKIRKSGIDSDLRGAVSDAFAKAVPEIEDNLYSKEEKERINRERAEAEKKRLKSEAFNINIGAGISQFSGKNMALSNSTITITAKDSADYSFGVEAGIGKDWLLCEGGAYYNPQLMIYKIGMGAAPKLLEFGTLSIRAGVMLNAVAVNGVIGKTGNYTSSVGNKEFSPGSDIEIGGLTGGIRPFVRIGVEMGGMIFFVDGGQAIYADMSSLKIKITDKKNPEINEIIKNSGIDYYPVINTGGISVKSGIQINF